MDSFANRFTKALELKNITAAELSRILGLNEGTISNYKKGNYVQFIKTYVKYARGSV